MADLRVETVDAIATVTLDRPDALNALTVPLKEALIAAFGELAADRAVRAVILTGAGRAFCAGQDLRERLEPGAAPLEVEIRERYNPLVRAIRATPQPVVAAVNGVAAGAGASLAFACDLRIAADSARFVLAFGQVGHSVFVGLPGNPVAAMVCFLLFARPVLLRLGGADWRVPTGFPVRAAFALTKAAGRSEYLRGTLTRDEHGVPLARRIERDGSGMLTSLVEAQGLVEIDATVTRVAPGDLVPFLSFAELGVPV